MRVFQWADVHVKFWLVQFQAGDQRKRQFAKEFVGAHIEPTWSVSWTRKTFTLPPERWCRRQVKSKCVSHHFSVVYKTLQAGDHRISQWHLKSFMSLLPSDLQDVQNTVELVNQWRSVGLLTIFIKPLNGTSLCYTQPRCPAVISTWTSSRSNHIPTVSQPNQTFRPDVRLSIPKKNIATWYLLLLIHEYPIVNLPYVVMLICSLKLQLMTEMGTCLSMVINSNG